MSDVDEPRFNVAVYEVLAVNVVNDWFKFVPTLNGLPVIVGDKVKVPEVTLFDLVQETKAVVSCMLVTAGPVKIAGRLNGPEEDIVPFPPGPTARTSTVWLTAPIISVTVPAVKVAVDETVIEVELTIEVTVIVPDPKFPVPGVDVIV